MNYIQNCSFGVDCSSGAVKRSYLRRHCNGRHRVANAGMSKVDSKVSVVASTWTLLCSAFLGSIIQPLMRKQVITKRNYIGVSR